MCQQSLYPSRRRRMRARGAVLFRADAPEGRGLFLGRGPLHSGVLQQLMHTELILPVQNCWYPEEAMRHAPDEAQDLR